MLAESSFNSSVDTFTAYSSLMSLSETTYQMIQKPPQQQHVVTFFEAMDLDEAIHPQLQAIHPETSEKALSSLVYSRKKSSMNAEHNLGKEHKYQDDSLDADSIVNPGESSTKRKDRFENCLVYYRKKKRKISTSCDGLDYIETKPRANRFDNCLVYIRKKGRGTKISCDQAESSSSYSSQNEQIVKGSDDAAFSGPNADGEVKNIDHLPNGCITESHISVPKRSSDGLFTYSRKKQRAKSVNVRVNGFLIYVRKKSRVKPIEAFTEENGTNGEDEKATDCCDSSDGDASETGTDDSSPFRQCKKCDKPGKVEKMLICDECEESYHTRCCGVRMKEVEEIDDWFCPSCLKNSSSRVKIKVRNLRERKWRVSKPFKIGIRIGKEFQANVPDWSGPTMSDTRFLGEPLEIDESECIHDLKKAKNVKKLSSAVNWLQCREEDSNGDICGKWRRAPRSDVQTKDWECFCCVFWDPSHADCAVPQELETNEVLKQLKHIKMLRPRSDVKRRKLGPKRQS